LDLVLVGSLYKKRKELCITLLTSCDVFSGDFRRPRSHVIHEKPPKTPKSALYHFYWILYMLEHFETKKRVVYNSLEKLWSISL